MKKFIFFIATLLFFGMNTKAATFNFKSATDIYQKIDNVLLELAQAEGSSAPFLATYNDTVMRLYAKNTITIVAEEITNVQFVFSKNENKTYATLTADKGILTSGGESSGSKDWKIDVWNGSADELVLTLGTSGQRNLKLIVVNGDPVVLEPEEEEIYIDTTSLNPAYVYSEPTIVQTPDKNFFKREYAFISNNIRIACTQGSILKATDTTEAYFNCNAGERITFTATKPIKGIAINGAVRKLFTAAANKGKMSYLQPDEFYWEDYKECEPVVLIKDIDSTAVTITCAKQLRCYSIQFYFEANPTAKIQCGDVINEGLDVLNEDSKTPLKILREGHIYILRDEQVYTIDGQRVTLTY